MNEIIDIYIDYMVNVIAPSQWDGHMNVVVFRGKTYPQIFADGDTEEAWKAVKALMS
jgi:hypothetical protein